MLGSDVYMESNLTIEKSPKQDFFIKLWKLALPISLQSMMFTVLGLIDIMMVSHLGETAVAAVGYGNRIFFFNLIIVVAFSSAMSILVAQYIGAGQYDGIRRTLVHSLLSSVVLTLPFIILYMVFTDTIVSWVGEDSKLLTLSTQYLLITAPSFLSTALVVPLEALLRSTVDPKAPTRIGFITILINIVLNYVFIFGAFGLPAMGVLGSALGTLLSRAFQTLLIIYYIYKVHPQLIPSREDIKNAFTLRRWSKYLNISVPMLLQDGLWSFGIVLYSLIYASLGVNELAVMTAISSVESIMISLFVGFAIAASIILGNELGANQFDKAWRESWYFMITAPIIALSIGLIIYLLDEQALMLFSQFEDESLLIAHQGLLIAAFALSIRVINLTGIVGILRSGGDVKATALINIIGMWFVGLPLCWIAANIWQWSLPMVFVCALMEEVTKSILVLARIASRHWLKNLVVNPEVANSPINQ